jgi:membrane protein
MARAPSETASPPRDTPDQPTELPKESWPAILKRTFKQFSEDQLTTWAAALTYFGVLSLFPMILALVSVLGVIGPSATQPLLDQLSTVAPGPAKEILTNVLTNRRPIWKKLPVRLGVTVVLLVLLTVTALAVVFTGPLAQKFGDLIGLGSTFVDVWSIAKWPVLLLIVSFMISLLYWACPNVKQPGFPWVTPGGLLAVVLWILASALFALYVANFGSYNKTYGSLGGVIVFLTWLWITNIIILLGAEFNSEMERSKAIQEGHPPDKEPYLPLRDDAKLKD